MHLTKRHKDLTSHSYLTSGNGNMTTYIRDHNYSILYVHNLIKIESKDLMTEIKP